MASEDAVEHGPGHSGRVNAAIDRWRAELLDLSPRNPLVHLRPGRGAFPLVHPTPDLLFEGLEVQERRYTIYRPRADETDTDEQFRLILNADQPRPDEPPLPVTVRGHQRPGAIATPRVEVSPILPPAPPPPRPPAPNEIVIAGEPRRIDAVLYRLRQRSRSFLQEQGINVLFVTFGTLEWTEAGASDVGLLSPLILVPVAIDRATALAPYTIRPLDDSLILNPVLVRKLALDVALHLELPDETEGDPTLTEALDHLRQAVAGQSTWRVRPDVYLGLFSFAKFAMYADLEASRERLIGHPLVRAIAGEEDGLPAVIDDLPTAEHLDEHVQPADVFQVLDADASQLEAIAAVRAGCSLVIQGPPGTGKSQTITNVIAETLAQGKTVLFVSEKMAALRVVAKRLAQAGLQEFCLEAHSQDANKAAVVRELKTVLDAGRALPADQSDLDLARLATLRGRLNAYVHALHDRVNPLGRSAFQIHGEVAARQHVPALPFELTAIGSLTPKRLAELLDVASQVVSAGEILLQADDHPWNGCLIPSFTPQLQAELDGQFQRVATVADELAPVQRSLRAAWGLPPAESLQAAIWLRDLLTILDTRPNIPLAWLRAPSLAPLLATAGDERQRMDDYHHRRRRLLAHYTSDIFGLDLTALEATLAHGGAPHADRVRGDGAAADRALSQRAVIEAAVERTVKALDGVGSAAGQVATRLGLATPASLNQARRLQHLVALVLTDPRPQRDWFAPGRLAAIEELVAEAGRQHATATTGRATLQAQFDDDFFTAATPELALRFETAYAAWFRVLKPSYHRDLGRLRRCLQAPAALDYPTALGALKLARRVAAAQTWLDDHRAALVAGLGHHFAGAQTDWARLAGVAATVRVLLTHLELSEAPARLQATLVGGPAEVRPYAIALDAALAEMDAAWAQLSEVAHLATVTVDGLAADDTATDRLVTWLHAWQGGLTPLWTAAATLLACRQRVTTSAASLLADVRDGQAVMAVEAGLAASDERLRGDFGHLFLGLATRWETVLDALGWTSRLVAHFAGPPPTSFCQVFAAGLSADTTERQRLTGAITTLSTLLTSLGAQFAADRFLIAATPPPEAHLADVAAWARAKQAALPRLEEWIDLAQALAAADRSGLTPFVDGLRRARPPREQWLDVFLRQIYTLWLTWWYAEQPALARFRGQRHAEIIAEFRRLDLQQCQAAARRIAQRLIPKRPVVSLALPPRSEPAILIKEASKKRRFRPLRHLFADLPNLLPALKPCLLMSPLSVAQYLGESALTFDVVIFDEASQILPADAIGAIGRGRQLVVVGDQQQLPPTRFFAVDYQAREASDEDEELPESILDSAIAARLPSLPLRWHYRSRHEHLIAFSNQHFYDQRLITFPSPDETSRAVEFIQITDGVYDRAGSRTNRVEARRIADLVVAHVEQQPARSLGVITFSEPQMLAILNELDQRKQARPELEPLLSEAGVEGFFVKNLENVQGDERDVIFFSVGYGPDQAGGMTMNFGPLNQQGGERRLNVAITRARHRVKILASFPPQAIDRHRTQARGVHLLRGYLEFADQGPRALLGAITGDGGEPVSPFEAAVAAALQAHDLHLIPQVGVGAFRIDLGVKDEAQDRYLLGIECDGLTYQASRTARDRDRLRQSVLEQLGWRLHRVWSTDWIKDPARETDRVLAAIKRATTMSQDPMPLATPATSDAPAATTGLVASAMPQAATPATNSPSPPPEPIARPYATVSLDPQGDLAAFRRAPIAHLAALVQTCVDLEGPVHQDRVMRIVAASFGTQRVGQRMSAKLLKAMDRAAGVARRDQFLWPATMTRPVARAADGEGNVRPIGEVPLEEIAVAVELYLERAFSIAREDLVAGLARELGYERTGEQIAAAITTAIDHLVAGGQLVDVGGQVRLAR